MCITTASDQPLSFSEEGDREMCGHLDGGCPQPAVEDSGRCVFHQDFDDPDLGRDLRTGR